MASAATVWDGRRPEQSWLSRKLDDRRVLAALFMLPVAALLLTFLSYPLGLGVWLAHTGFGHQHMDHSRHVWIQADIGFCFIFSYVCIAVNGHT